MPNAKREGEFDFGAGVGSGPDAEAGADVGGAFAHDTQAPVGFAAGAEELGVDACAVVADGYAQLAGGIFEFDLDLFCLGMAQGVKQGFAGDQVDLVKDGWIEVFWAAHFCDAQSGAVGGREFIEEIGKRLIEGSRWGFGGAESFEGGAAFGDSLAHQLADTAQERLRG